MGYTLTELKHVLQNYHRHKRELIKIKENPDKLRVKKKNGRQSTQKERNNIFIYLYADSPIISRMICSN